MLRNPMPDLNQYMTPAWAAEALVERYFADLTGMDLVLEPACGKGAFLQACLTHGIPCVGVEIDPALAAEAVARTGAQVRIGDFRTLCLDDVHPTAILTNPPFQMSWVQQLLSRAATLLPERGKIGLILPAYMMRVAERIMTWHHRWSITAECLPRTLFPLLSYPLVFARFSKDATRVLVGFALYQETAAVRQMSSDAQALLTEGGARKGAWRSLVEAALEQLGGQGTLQEIYALAMPNALPGHRFPEAKIRQSLQRYCRRIDRGFWALTLRETATVPIAA
jgi:site-specific DNA-methyltransferase (adenine-specific)